MSFARTDDLGKIVCPVDSIITEQSDFTFSAYSPFGNPALFLDYAAASSTVDANVFHSVL